MFWRRRAQFKSGRSLSPLPPLCVGIPNAIGEQPIQIGKVWITVDVEAQAFAIVLARPLAIPRLPPRIIRVEVRAPERLPTAMRTAFNVAASAMAFADTRTAIGTGSEFLAHVGRSKTAMRFVRWSVNRSLNALFYFHTRGTIVGRGFLNVRAHLQLHRLASRRAGAERVRLIRTVSLSAGLPSRSIWPQVFAECGGLLPTAASRIWAACGIRTPTWAAPRISTERIWT